MKTHFGTILKTNQPRVPLGQMVNNFINTQANNYDQISWYKKPKYWLLLWFVGFVVLMMIKQPMLRDMDYFIRHLFWIIPLLPFILRGYVFPFVLLLFLKTGFSLFVGIRGLVYGWWQPSTIMLLKWLFVIFVGGCLIYLCFCIERKANKKHKWQQVLFDTIIGLILFGLCFWFIIW